jgi:aspartate carbamoyltransferase catalytic subunit
MTGKKRDINSINDLEDAEIEDIFALADEYSRTMARPGAPHRIRGRRSEAGDFILATLFYEPSTRTRFSFESAMLRLGGSVLASSDPATTSAAKGESLADTVRVIENYADLIVLRHPCEGASRAAAEYVDIPIINGGDGAHEHPTQTLCDLYTLRSERKSIKGLNVLLIGDLKNGRTVHSLVFGLARFGANIITMPAEGLELPSEVHDRLHDEFRCEVKAGGTTALSGKDGERAIGAVYIASAQGPQFSLLENDDADVIDLQKRLGTKIDVCYVTRPQKERFSAAEGNLTQYPIVNREFLQGEQYKKARVLHPLPRVGELDYELDRDPRGVYFKQAGYGVPIRMALIAKVLGIEPFKSVHVAAGGAAQIYEHEHGILCPNPRCITHNPAEQRYLAQRAHVLTRDGVSLRCAYCDAAIPIAVLGHKRTKTYEPNAGASRAPALAETAFFRNEEDARRAGYRPKGDGRREHG